MIRSCAIAVLCGLVLGTAGCTPAKQGAAFSPTGAMFVPDHAEAAGGPWEGYIVKILVRVPGGFTVCPRLHSEPMNYQVGSRCRQASANGMGVDTTEITGRVSTGTVTFRNTSVATKNWIEMARTSAKVPLLLKHGQAAINTVSIAAPLAQIGKPTFGEQDGIQMITVPLRFIPSDAGNDEWSITV